MAGTAIERVLPDEQATVAFGQDLAAALKPGDLLLLQGDLGAGKTTLARALIRAMAADQALEVPSPTFTLVQTYDTRIPLAHFDLYRISAAEELDELGLDEALAAGAALVEWPERAEDRLPSGAVTIRLADRGEGRLAIIEAAGEALHRIRRSLDIRDFLDAAGWPHVTRAHLTGDASARAYETVSLPGRADHIVMNAPPLVRGPPIRDGRSYADIVHTARNVDAFVAIDHLLASGGIAVPEIAAQDLDRGLLLISHLGSGNFLDAGEPVAERYAAAAELLAFLHGRKWPRAAEAAPGRLHAIPPFDREAMLSEAELLLDWYLPFARGDGPTPSERQAFAAAWSAAFDRLAGCEESLVLRDYHSPNLIWRPERRDRDRLGVIDFQDALVGPAAYDVASLALDARVTIAPEFERATVEAYTAARAAAGPFDRASFDRAYAIMGAQRNSKILGIFVRLDRRDGKPQYLKHLPRIRDYLGRTLAHPALAEIRDLYRRLGIFGDTP